MKKQLNPKAISFPQPVFIIGSYDEDGVANAMNAAWVGQTTFATIEINLSAHKSTDNILARRAFTVAPANLDNLVVSDYVGISTGRKVNKEEATGLTFTKSERVDAPVIEEFPVTFECEVVEVQELEHDWRIVGKVVGVLADEEVLDEKGQVDADRVKFLNYYPGDRSYRVMGTWAGNAFDAGKPLIKK